MAILSDEESQQRDKIARLLTSLAGLADPQGMSSSSLLPPTPDIFPHSPTSSFDFAAGYSPAASTAAIGMFDPTGSSPTMQGGAPAPTGRDAFSSTPAQDWGGVFDPSDAPTMTAPDMTASPHATPTFDVDQTGMPNAPSFDNTPAAPNEGASLTDPGPGFSSGFAAGFSSAVAGMGEGVGGVGEGGGGGLGAVGGTEGSGSGDTSAGSVG